VKKERKGIADKQTIQVVTAPSTAVRGRSSVKELAIDTLADNVESFLKKVGNILDKAPDAIGKFQLAEFAVSAEISANGKLTLLGIGGEAGASGGITFTFKRNP